MRHLQLLHLTHLQSQCICLLHLLLILPQFLRLQPQLLLLLLTGRVEEVEVDFLVGLATTVAATAVAVVVAAAVRAVPKVVAVAVVVGTVVVAVAGVREVVAVEHFES